MKLEGFDIRTIHPTGAYSASRYRLARIRVDERAKEEQHFYIFFGQDPKAVCIRFGERSRILSLVSEIMKQYCIIEVHIYDASRDEMTIVRSIQSSKENR